jgi:hypothetical protein
LPTPPAISAIFSTLAPKALSSIFGFIYFKFPM